VKSFVIGFTIVEIPSVVISKKKNMPPTSMAINILNNRQQWANGQTQFRVSPMFLTKSLKCSNTPSRRIDTQSSLPTFFSRLKVLDKINKMPQQYYLIMRISGFQIETSWIDKM
jgi:hypothetical protein